MISRHAVAAQQGEVFDIGGGFRLLAVDGSWKLTWRSASRGHAEAQGERLAGGGAAVALFARQFAHSGLKSQAPCAPDFSALARMGGCEIAVGHALLRRSRPPLAGAGRGGRTGGTVRPSRGRAIRRPSKMELSEASVLRSTSVSSMRRIMVPPLSARIEPVENEGARAPDVQKARRRGRETDSKHGNFNCSVWQSYPDAKFRQRKAGCDAERKGMKLARYAAEPQRTPAKPGAFPVSREC